MSPPLDRGRLDVHQTMVPQGSSDPGMALSSLMQHELEKVKTRSTDEPNA